MLHRQGFSSSVCQAVVGAIPASVMKVYQCWKNWVGWCVQEGIPNNAISASKLADVLVYLFWCCNVGWGRRDLGGTPGRDILTSRKNFAPPFWGGVSPEWVYGADCVGVTVNEDPTCPAGFHPKSGATSTCHAFLFKGRSLTLMYKACLMVLVMPCNFLSTKEKFSSLMRYPVVWEWSKVGGGALRCSFYFPTKFLPVSSMYFIVHPGWSHLYL